MKSTLVNMVLSLGRHHDSGRRRACRSLHRHQAAHRRSKGRKAESRDRPVLPEISFNNNPAEEAAEVTVDGETVTVFPARQDGELVGLAVESHDTNGFSGLITVMYGFNPSGDITGYAVMQHAETPGLGSKMGEWFCNPAHSIIGLNAATSNLTVSKDGGDVDAITAATISSRAFLRALTLPTKPQNNSLTANKTDSKP